jgi:hypothetical protein
MKKLILLFFIVGIVFLMPKQTQAQNEYRPMAVEDAHWVVYSSAEIDPYSPITGAWEYYCHGDTTTNQITYKKIYRRYLEIPESLYSPRPFYPISPYTLVALMRDDIEARKVYAIILDENIQTDCSLHEEVTLYDFPLNAGDAVDFCILPTGIDPIVYEIYEDQRWGETIKVYVFATLIYRVQYYEVMGGPWGLFEETTAAEFTISGFYNHLRYYCVDCDDQFVVATEDYEATTAGIKLIPNPAKETVHIQFIQSELVRSFQICNLYGNVLYTQVINGTTEHTLDVSKLATGIYLVYFYNQNNQVLEVKKLLVTH